MILFGLAWLFEMEQNDEEIKYYFSYFIYCLTLSQPSDNTLACSFYATILPLPLSSCLYHDPINNNAEKIGPRSDVGWEMGLRKHGPRQWRGSCGGVDGFEGKKASHT